VPAEAIDLRKTRTTKESSHNFWDEAAQLGAKVADGSISPETALGLAAPVLSALAVKVAKQSIRRLFRR